MAKLVNHMSLNFLTLIIVLLDKFCPRIYSNTPDFFGSDILTLFNYIFLYNGTIIGRFICQHTH